jgi:hypothetical protein
LWTSTFLLPQCGITSPSAIVSRKSAWREAHRRASRANRLLQASHSRVCSGILRKAIWKK